MLSNRLTDDYLFILDGDEYNTQEKKTEGINEALTGTTEENYEMRNKLLNYITQFNLPDGYKPEFFIHSLLKELPPSNQIILTALEIYKEDNAHNYVDEIIERIGYPNRDVGLSKVISVVQNHEKWEHYISPIKNWLKAHGERYREENPYIQELQTS